MSTAIATGSAGVGRDTLDAFFEQLSGAREAVLLLDYDGTIAPFSPYRDRAYPYPSVPDLLDCIMSTCRTRIVLISGRAAREIPPLLGLNPHPEIWGSYGIERLQTDGRYAVAEVNVETQQALAEATARLEREGLAALVEMKPGAIAVHWRGLTPPHAEEVKAAAYRLLAPLALRTHLLLTEFEGGLELRQSMCNKGDVVRSVLSEHGPDVPVAYLGDDGADEDAFRALNSRGLTVLVRRTHRFTAARSWIHPPEGLVQFFAEWIRASGGDL